MVGVKKSTISGSQLKMRSIDNYPGEEIKTDISPLIPIRKKTTIRQISSAIIRDPITTHPTAVYFVLLTVVIAHMLSPLFIILTTKRRQFGKIKLFISETPKGNSEEEKKRRKKTTQARKKQDRKGRSPILWT
jgi:uncharacterized protein YacL